jgi:hypothetical protein
MKKIPTIFERDWDNNPSLVTPTRNPECQWVFNGEGQATRKYDGVCCWYDGTQWFKRFTTQHSGFQDDKGKSKRPQSHPDFVSATEIDPLTGKQEGWVPITDTPENKNMIEAIKNLGIATSGTYEFLGPKSQGNVEKLDTHTMQKHADAAIVFDCPRTYEELRSFLTDKDIEGIVWHHSDGKMAKIKLRDFGLKRR